MAGLKEQNLLRGFGQQRKKNVAEENWRKVK